jgi:hypothetical protein
VETILTVIETCRQQGRAVFDFLTTAPNRPLRTSTNPHTPPRGVKGYTQRA